MENKVYLGDAVYAEVERGMLKLTTDYGFGPTNEIFLESEVYERLIEFINSRNNTQKAPTSSVKQCTSDRPQCPDCGSDSVTQTKAADFCYSAMGSPAVYKCLSCGCHFNFDDGCTG